MGRKYAAFQIRKYSKVSRRNRNFRQGDNAESLAELLLKQFSTVTSVPRSEDIGIDAYCCLLRSSGRSLHGEDTFAIQVKTKSVRTIEYSRNQLAWFRRLEVPLFIVSVDARALTAEIYSTEHLHACLEALRSDEFATGIVMCLDPPASISRIQPWAIPRQNGEDRCWLGAPLLMLDSSTISNRDTSTLAYLQLKRWLDAIGKARRVGRYGAHIEYRVGTDGEPVVASILSNRRDDSDDLLIADLEVLLWRLEMMVSTCPEPYSRSLSMVRCLVDAIREKRGVDRLGPTLFPPPPT